MRNNISGRNRQRGQEIGERLEALGWQNVHADEDFFAGVTGTYGELQIDVVFDATRDIFVTVSYNRPPRIGQTRVSYTYGQVAGALAQADLLNPRKL